MSLSSGTRLGPYEILGPLGAGGMGEVYEAKDTRLDRRVAIKVMPARVSESAHLRQRFEREARALASFSHPHICTLHDVGHENGIDFLVMECLEGVTLASRLERGPLPIEQALRTATELAGALDSAHRQGVVHRDLKPGNVMLTKTGAKLLDFGLARAAANVVETAVAQPSAAPTRSQPITTKGEILGTLEYMAPEQLEGQEADARTDVFALGTIAYEMLTGRRAFPGRSQASIITAILSSEPPPPTTLQPMTPAALERAIKRCMAKDPDQRWQSVRDLALELEWIAAGGSTDERSSPGPAGPRSRARLAWVAAVVALATILGVAALRFNRPDEKQRAARFSLSLPGDAASLFVRVSPNGKYLSSTAVAGDKTQIWLRPLDDLSARPLPGTEGAWAHFWSPDSRFIAYFAEGKLKKLDISGGLPQELCDAPGSGPFQLGAWSSDGTILFRVDEAPGHEEGLYRVADTGGSAERMIILDETGEELMVFWPSFLPDGRHFVFACAKQVEGGDIEAAGTCVASLTSGRARKLLETASYAVYAPPGYLLYARGAALFAHSFDAGGLHTKGDPFRIVAWVESWFGVGAPSFSVSENGVLAYQVPGGQSRLVWRDRRGAEIGFAGLPADYFDMRLSPDGRNLAATIADPRNGEHHIWMIELARNVATRFTSEDADAGIAIWSADGSRIVYCKPENAPPFLHHKSLAGGEEEVLLPSRGTLQCPTDWSQDGRFVLYEDRDPTTGFDVWVLPLGGGQQPTPLLHTSNRETDATFSPDGSWVTYVSDESGRSEVYLQPFQRLGEKRRISVSGGSLPRWRADGRELYYLGADNQLMAVPVESGTSVKLGAPETLFTAGTGPSTEVRYDVSPDGQRFLVKTAIPGTAATPTVVLNWTAELPEE